MHDDLRSQFESIEDQRKALLSEAGLLNETQLNWKKSPQSWSIAQIIQHLVLIDETLCRVHEERAVPEVKMAFRLIPTGLRYEMVLDALKNDRELPLPTPAVKPSSDVEFHDLPMRWNTARGNVQRALESPRIDQLRYFHPFLGCLTMEQMLELENAHMSYHSRQIEALRKSDGFPADDSS